ncbi:MAG TPA: hypothetical protein VMX55_05585 [candidate division Zixibacteria bacterium]|nr:hypothetical protein [candidate division Zixibacteria bacterium]
MSAQEITEPQKVKIFAKWREYPLEIKIMDFASLAWLAITIIEIIFYAAKINVNIRIFPAFMLPIFMFIATLSLRLKLVEKPALIKNIFYTWLTLFVVYLVVAILLLILYPPLL